MAEMNNTENKADVLDTTMRMTSSYQEKKSSCTAPTPPSSSAATAGR